MTEFVRRHRVPRFTFSLLIAATCFAPTLAHAETAPTVHGIDPLAAPLVQQTLPPTTSGEAPSPGTRKSIRVVASSLAIVLGGFAFLLVLFRRSPKTNAGATMMDTLGKVRVTPKVELHLVRLGNRILVLHLAADAVHRVAEIDDPQEVQDLLQASGAAPQELLSNRVGDLIHDPDSILGATGMRV